METILFEYIVSLGLSLSIAILVAVRAGRMIHHINAINVKIIYQLEILYKVYRDTTEGVHLPAGVNLQEVSTHLFFVDERVSLLNSIYCDLIAKGTGSEYFGQVIQFLLG